MALSLKLRAGARGLCAVAAVTFVTALGVEACHKGAPAGQVLATVGGKDVTLQDVRAEERADGVPASAGQTADAAILQRVIDRELLVQSAHAQKLDQNPDSPSDLARVEQTWLADKAARLLLNGMAPPTDAQAQAFIGAHPYAFAKRERISARTITIAAAPALLTQLKTYTSYDQAYAFLKRLGVAMATGTGQIDTAQIPPGAAAQVVATPVGTLLITQPPGRIQLAEIQSHTLVAVSPADQLVLAKRTIASEAASQRVAAALVKLKADTPVTYQPGYAPKAATSPAAGGAPLSGGSKAS